MTEQEPRSEDGARPKGGRVVKDAGTLYAVKVEVDGRELELREFLHDVVGGAVNGLLSGLRGVDEPNEIVVRVRRR